MSLFILQGVSFLKCMFIGKVVESSVSPKSEGCKAQSEQGLTCMGYTFFNRFGGVVCTFAREEPKGGSELTITCSSV